MEVLISTRGTARTAVRDHRRWEKEKGVKEEAERET